MKKLLKMATLSLLVGGAFAMQAKITLQDVQGLQAACKGFVDSFDYCIDDATGQLNAGIGTFQPQGSTVADIVGFGGGVGKGVSYVIAYANTEIANDPLYQACQAGGVLANNPTLQAACKGFVDSFDYCIDDAKGQLKAGIGTFEPQGTTVADIRGFGGGVGKGVSYVIAYANTETKNDPLYQACAQIADEDASTLLQKFTGGQPQRKQTLVNQQQTLVNQQQTLVNQQSRIQPGGTTMSRDKSQQAVGKLTTYTSMQQPALLKSATHHNPLTADELINEIKIFNLPQKKILAGKFGAVTAVGLPGFQKLLAQNLTKAELFELVGKK